MDLCGRTFSVAILGLAGFSLPSAESHETTDTFRYLRRSGAEFVQESEIQLRRSAETLVVTSVTRRGEQKLTVVSQYNSDKVLRSAKVTVQRDPGVKRASVVVRQGTAQVRRDAGQTNTLRCPRGVIVTSAPDWTDSFMAVRRYDPTGDTTQTFAGLWIHPSREPLDIAITLTRLGRNTVKLRNDAQVLDRFLLVLRGGSRYVVWANQQGQLVRLVPEMNAEGGIVLTGWENAIGDLKP